MTLTIAGLVIGLAVVVCVFVTKNNEIKENVRISNAIADDALEQVAQLKQDNTTLGQELEILRAQADFGLEYVGEFDCTAYCTEQYEHICGEGHGVTASGQPVQAGVSVAVSNTDQFPYGTILYIEGVGIRIVQDTGGALHERQVDVAVDTHEHALDWGIQQNRKVFIVKAGSINGQ
jgi:3D (Asp-Asp-Asp) domain-containing protein